MEEWKEYRIGEIAKTNVSQYSLSENWEIIQYLDTGSITMNQISNIGLFNGNEGLPSRARRKVKNGDIIFSAVRPNLCHYGYMVNPPSNLLVSTGFVVISVDTTIADPLYVYFYLTQDEIVNHLHAIGEQAVSTYPTIRPSDIEDLSIILPPISKQKRISAILYSIDSKISCDRRINDNLPLSLLLLIYFVLWLLKLRNDNLQYQAQALYKSWFVDYEPFKDGEFVESELGMIPKGWRAGSLSDIANVTMGTSPAGSSYNVTGEGDVFYQGRAEFGFRFPTRNMYTTEAKRFAEIDSVLLSVRAPVGDIDVAEERCCIGRGLASVQSKTGNNSFMLYLMQNLQPVFDRFNGEGTVFGCINKNALENLTILIPDRETMARFDDVCCKMDGQIKTLDQESRRLAELRDTLLPRLMSGELNINTVNL